MNAATYQLSGMTGLLVHGWSRPEQVRDGIEPYIELEARVRSGDYFVTIASELDQLSQDVNEYGTKVHLENLVSDLIYLQDNFTIIKNEQAE
jgi:hypothetical protein